METVKTIRKKCTACLRTFNVYPIRDYCPKCGGLLLSAEIVEKEAKENTAKVMENLTSWASIFKIHSEELTDNDRTVLGALIQKAEKIVKTMKEKNTVDIKAPGRPQLFKWRQKEASSPGLQLVEGWGALLSTGKVLFFDLPALDGHPVYQYKSLKRSSLPNGYKIIEWEGKPPETPINYQAEYDQREDWWNVTKNGLWFCSCSTEEDAKQIANALNESNRN